MVEDIETFYNFLGHKEETELRLIKEGEIIQTWVNNYKDFLKEIQKNDGLKDIYAGINERESKGDTDKSVKFITHIGHDIDAHSGKPEDFSNAQEIALNIKEDCIKNGYEEPLLTCSGRGFWIIHHIEPIENTEENVKKIKEFGRKIKLKYEVLGVELDSTVYNPSRIVRVPGTINIKHPDKIRGFIVGNYSKIPDKNLTTNILSINLEKPTTTTNAITPKSSCAILDYCLTHEIPKGERHKIISRNMSLYILEHPDKELLKQQYYKIQKGSEKELDGWLRNIEQEGKEKYPFSCGELINFQKKYKIPLKCKGCPKYLEYKQEKKAESNLQKAVENENKNPKEEIKEEQTTEENISLKETYKLIIDVLKYYCDIEEKYYSLIAIWIIGTYYHNDFPTYPYLFFNAMRGSGKSRVLRLITYLSKDGSMLNSLTEAVLFRTKGTLAIDEFEGVGRKGNESLKELLNSAYKKGIKVKRMKKNKTFEGETMVVEEFDVYRPILLANIAGMEEVLGDRCIQIILSKSDNSRVTKKVEIYEQDYNVTRIKTFSKGKCRLCSVVSLPEMYKEWNSYIHNLKTNNTNNIHNIHNTHNTNNTNELFKELDDSGIDGRNLELMFPLIIIAHAIDEDVFSDLMITLKEIVKEKKKEDIVESIDVALIDFVSQQLELKWYISKDLINDFKKFIQLEDEWINDRWLGKALKRLALIQDKKRMNFGRMYMFDINKAQKSIGMFK